MLFYDEKTDMILYTKRSPEYYSHAVQSFQTTSLHTVVHRKTDTKQSFIFNPKMYIVYVINCVLI